jgi:hypothetical protein
MIAVMGGNNLLGRVCKVVQDVGFLFYSNLLSWH